jgi:exopolysaccharide biosynthesis polyprenyl glycosylphosphotransferase
MVTKALETRETVTQERPVELEIRTARRSRSFPKLLSRTSTKRIIFLAGDALAITLAHGTAESVVQHLLRVPREYLNPPNYFLFSLPFLVGVLYLFEGYQSPDLRRPEKELALVLKAVSFSFLTLFCANFVFLKTIGFSRYLMLSWYLLAVAFLLVSRFGLRELYGALGRRGLAQQSALLVGSLKKLADFQRVLSLQRCQGYRLLGMIPAPGNPTETTRHDGGLPVVGSFGQWEEIALQHGVQLIVVSLPTNSAGSHEAVLDIVRRCQARGIDVEVYSDLFASSEFNYELDEFSGFFRFYATPRWSRAVQRFVKVVLDRFIGLAGSLVTLSIAPIVGLLIKLEDRGPIFYRREFVGCDGEIHHYRKFRTMRQDSDRLVHEDPALKAKFDEKYKLVDDPRVLRVGRFLRKYSIDEFPQFFSLLAGKLTFVGPRVICQEEKERYGPLLPKLLSVKPGITGFWQVMGRQNTTYDERVQMDMIYIDHWSIWLDLLIVAKTFWKVLRSEGAY